ncbi:transcriptional regulator, TetR family [Arthrobacter sp. yr096]|uniref:TetR/AcrR family transcriptional regulator n=1 Tax=Arthrobacter sp. yr096 TaxID=1761750 RepID=UPI0008D63B93|nr:TetR/AcrR family transcriptional regulator [Arthrobacter sp. yr096]SEI95547.1 transcriptional regulator, TetR family [Arthrobacter sp. yr096]
MAWDTERTKTQLLDAAVSEFSAKGLAGARMDHIAKAAGVSKERIYQYFGNKDALYGAVITAELNRFFMGLSIEGSGVAAVGDFAGRLFDFHAAEPGTAKLLFWVGLEEGVPAGREAICREQTPRLIREMRRALPGILDHDATDLLVTILTLCSAGVVLSQVDLLMAGAGSGRTDRRRKAIVLVATLAAQDLATKMAGQHE